jgi:arsenate reductase (thioredoxin)
MEKRKERVLFLCTHNSARSQMAEGFLRTLYGDKYEAYSAGSEPTSLNSYVVKAMAEIGIDISAHRSKSINQFKKKEFEYVVTMCDKAKEELCSFYYGHKMDEVSFSDPSDFKGHEEEVLSKVRTVRDAIKEYVIKNFGK